MLKWSGASNCFSRRDLADHIDPLGQLAGLAAGELAERRLPHPQRCEVVLAHGRQKQPMAAEIVTGRKGAEAEDNASGRNSLAIVRLEEVVEREGELVLVLEREKDDESSRCDWPLSLSARRQKDQKNTLPPNTSPPSLELRREPSLSFLLLSCCGLDLELDMHG